MIISKTPLRISFAGGGTDLPSYYSRDFGAVLSSTIDKYVYVIIKERFDDWIYINWSKKEIVDTPNAIEHDLVREAVKKAGIEKGVEVTTLADIPSEGSGLGSSSALTVGLLNAFYTYMGEQVSTERLAEEACEIEIDIIGKPIGKQDHYAAAYGGLNELVFHGNGDVSVHKIKLSNEAFRNLGTHLLLFYTNITRKAAPILGEQSRKTGDLFGTLTRMRDQVPLFKKLIEDNEVEGLGQHLDTGWSMKRSLLEAISNPEIDEMYTEALKAGALGGKVCGAGAGGFLLVFAPPGRHNAIRKALHGYRELPFMLERYGSRIAFNQRLDYWK